MHCQPRTYIPSNAIAETAKFRLFSGSRRITIPLELGKKQYTIANDDC
jgi:hypothetical protein